MDRDQAGQYQLSISYIKISNRNVNKNYNTMLQLLREYDPEHIIMINEYELGPC